MGVIQSGVNQLFSTLGAFTMMSPEMRMKREKEQKIQSLQKQKESVTKARDITAGQAETEAAEGYQADITEIQKQLFEADPSIESYKEYVTSKPSPSTSMPAESWEIEEERRSLQPEQVMAKMSEKGKQQVKQNKQRRNFIEFLKSGQLEGTEGLGDAALSQIASQYSKGAKTELMNQYKYKTGGKK